MYESLPVEGQGVNPVLVSQIELSCGLTAKVIHYFERCFWHDPIGRCDILDGEGEILIPYELTWTRLHPESHELMVLVQPRDNVGISPFMRIIAEDDSFSAKLWGDMTHRKETTLTLLAAGAIDPTGGLDPEQLKHSERLSDLLLRLPAKNICFENPQHEGSAEEDALLRRCLDGFGFVKNESQPLQGWYGSVPKANQMGHYPYKKRRQPEIKVFDENEEILPGLDWEQLSREMQLPLGSVSAQLKGGYLPRHESKTLARYFLTATRAGGLKSTYGLYGDAGAMKSSLALEVAQHLGLPFYCQVFSTDSKVEDCFVQMRQGKDGIWEWMPQPAYHIVKYGGVLEAAEVNMLLGGEATKLYTLFDGNGSITLPSGEILKKHPYCYIISTVNVGEGYSGTQVISPALHRRLGPFSPVRFPDVEQITDIVLANIAPLNSEAYLERKDVSEMAKAGAAIRNAIAKEGQGNFGTTELIDWAISSIIHRSRFRGAFEVISAASCMNNELSLTLMQSCVATKISPKKKHEVDFDWAGELSSEQH